MLLFFIVSLLLFYRYFFLIGNINGLDKQINQKEKIKARCQLYITSGAKFVCNGITVSRFDERLHDTFPFNQDQPFQTFNIDGYYLKFNFDLTNVRYQMVEGPCAPMLSTELTIEEVPRNQKHECSDTNLFYTWNNKIYTFPLDRYKALCSDIEYKNTVVNYKTESEKKIDELMSLIDSQKKMIETFNITIDKLLVINTEQTKNIEVLSKQIAENNQNKINSDKLISEQTLEINKLKDDLYYCQNDWYSTGYDYGYPEYNGLDSNGTNYDESNLKFGKQHTKKKIKVKDKDNTNKDFKNKVDDCKTVVLEHTKLVDIPKTNSNV
jgi:hypothetical protein